LPFAGCAGVGTSAGFFVAVLRLAVLDRFVLFVTIHSIPEDASLYRKKISAAARRDPAFDSRSECLKMFEGDNHNARLGLMNIG
jgi:hypothetical protein